MNLTSMIEELLRVNKLNWEIPADEQAREELLDVLRTISRPAELSETYYKHEAVLIRSKRDLDECIEAMEIENHLMEKVELYLGDITKIKADAIVNAANEKLLGCFVPGHHCIDNAIHMAAGLKLRNACDAIMRDQGHDELPGQAKITSGYELPSKYVIHTVGPNVHQIREELGAAAELMIAKRVEAELTHCYESILDLAEEQGDIKSLVFCSISTGIYGVSIDIASKLALKTIQGWLKTHKHHLEKVIINVFSQEDYNEYKKQAQQI